MYTNEIKSGVYSTDTNESEKLGNIQSTAMPEERLNVNDWHEYINSLILNN